MACFLTRRVRLTREISTRAQGRKHDAKMWRFGRFWQIGCRFVLN